MANRFHYVAADELVKLVVTCTDQDGVAINLTGGSANLRWRTQDGTVVNKAMTLETPASGIVSYTFQTGELVAPSMEYEVTVTKADGTIVTSLEAERLGVRARLA